MLVHWYNTKQTSKCWKFLSCISFISSVIDFIIHGEKVIPLLPYLTYFLFKSQPTTKCSSLTLSKSYQQITLLTDNWYQISKKLFSFSASSQHLYCENNSGHIWVDSEIVFTIIFQNWFTILLLALVCWLECL